MNEYQMRYANWMSTKNKAEGKLYETVLDYDADYFQDMRFAEDSIVAPFLKFDIEEACGEMVEQVSEIEDKFTCIGTNGYRFLIASLDDDTCAITNSEERVVTFHPDHAENKIVILHELIHVHENILGQGWSQLKEILLLQLYRKLQGCIPELDNRIIDHAHLIPGVDIARVGGSHGILFFLKSLDLDLRCNWKLGTVCMYGRDTYDSRSEA